MAPLHGANWEIEGKEAKLLALGAPGNVPDLDAVILARHARQNEIVDRLALSRKDVVLDLGSGMGFLAEVLAPQVARLHCADISETFLTDCRARLAPFGNVECHQIEYANLSALYGKNINKAYATLLFIHFNFYDIFFYLTELNKVLEPGGLLYFDYNDGDRFSLAEKTDSFHGHLALYKENREHWIFGCMHMTSLGVLKNIAPQLGFSVVKNWPSTQCFSQILLRKNPQAY
jgi:cyclopropane fatty-acyl-phospholipid synthase-like methyltransferase